MYEPQPPQDEPEARAEPDPPSPGRSRWRRYSLGLLALVVAIVAGAITTFFTVDLGPSLRERAEREGSKFIQRPMHIGRLSTKITPGVFVVEDLVIEGLQPTDRPFLKARKIEVVLPWWTIFRPGPDRRVGRDDRLGHGRRNLAVEPGVPPRAP